MATKTNLLNQKFGRLTVFEFIGMDKNSQSLWKTICDCGSNKIVITTGNHLKSKHTQSCGCLREEKVKLMEWEVVEFTVYGREL